MAIALSKGHQDIAVDIYEGAHQLNEIGAGVAMWRRPFQVMKAFGLKESMSQQLEEAPSEEIESMYHDLSNDFLLTLTKALLLR